jgi:histone H3/H4
MTAQNTLNVGQLIRKNSPCNVSAGAVKEFIGYLNALIPSATVRLCEIAKQNKRKTILERDVVELFSYKNNGVIPEED